MLDCSSKHGWSHSIPSVKAANAALFYIVDRRATTAEGIDLDVRVVAAKTQVLEKALEAGPFPNVPVEPKCYLDLAADKGTPGRLASTQWPESTAHQPGSELMS